MHLYFEILHKFQNQNCTHDIYIYTDIADLKYKHNVIHECNSDNYREFNSDNNGEADDEFVDLYEYISTEDSIVDIDDLWMIFSFYENSINFMNIFVNQVDAKRVFNEMLKESYLEPSDCEISVLEKDIDNNMIYTLYCKSNGKYELPDKAHRLVLQKFNIYKDTCIRL